MKTVSAARLKEVLAYGKAKSGDTQHKLPSSVFGLPEQRNFLEDRTHPIKAEEFATKEEHAGKLSPAQLAPIRAKANRSLGA